MKKIILPLALLFIAVTAFCQNPRMLKDVFAGSTGSSIQQIVKTSNYTFFNAEDDDLDADRGLYRTDGTPAGTIKLNLSYVPDTPPSVNNYASTKAEKLTALGNKIIFAGDNIANYGEIWSSDGTQAGTIALERFQPTLTNVKPVMDMATLGNEVMYGVVNSSNRSLLKKTDGTAAGTSIVYDFSSLDRAIDLALFKTINNILYFNVYDIAGTGYDQLWRSDGTTAGTYMLKDFGADHYVASTYMNAGSFFYIMLVQPGTGNVLWKSDGTAAGTVELKTIGTLGNNNYPAFAAIGNTLYFAGLDGNGKELWKTDGTAAGTVMVSDINPGTASSNPFFFTILNNNIYFSATTANEGAELWKFDGVNTSLVKDINSGTAGSAPGSLVVSNNAILFRALTATSGSELWITDGTSANTLQIADINPGTANAVPNILTPGNPVYFSASNGLNGSEIFAYDNSEGINGLHKIYVNDNSIAADVFTTAVGDNNNTGTKSSPFATLSYALFIAAAGDTVVVDAGTFAEQVIIDKGITIKGAGQNLTSFIPPSTALVPAPGPFTEIGLFETTQGIGDVHISNISVNSNDGSSQNIIIQSGGSVKNCTLLNGGQGIFFRIETGIKTAVVENNLIQPSGIGVNCQGSGLTAIITNNTISGNPGFYAGVFAGLDFGPLVQLTATGNLINNYFGYGFLANSFNSTITQNSIVGTGTYAIQRHNNGAVPNATCNWFGTTDAEQIKLKISGAINYTPWLVNGTDNDPATQGFQLVPGNCSGRQNKFYVNDNSQSGDVFTTAVGNNANNGFSTAPFSTPDYAYSQTQAGDTIYVDAGIYNMGGLTYSFPKAVTFLGSNYNLSPNDGANKLLPNAGRNAESIMTNAIFTIASSGLSFKGFTLDMGDRRAIELQNSIGTNNDFGNFLFEKNVLKINTAGNFNQFPITGKLVTSPAMPVTAGYTFMDNRFEKSGSATGTTFNFNYIKNITIANNAFVVTGATVKTQQVANLGGTGMVDSIYFSNNAVSAASTVVNNNRVANEIISGNKIINCDRGLNVSTGIQESTSVEFSNNSLENTTGGGGFIGYNRNGISFPGTNNLFKVENNTITGVAVPGLSGQFFGSMNFSVNNSILNPSIIIRGNKITYSGDFSSVTNDFVRPITIRGNVANLILEKNELTLNNAASMLQRLVTSTLPANPAITINTDFGSNAYMPSTAVINILNNKVQGFKQSVVFYDPFNGINPFIGYGNIPTGATVNINNNSFTGDSLSINNGAVGEIVNATCNWYGGTASQNVSTKITETTVNHSPWLTNATDTDLATGFQPVTNVCNGIPLDADIILVKNVTCNGAANGSIDVLVENGLAPFTYAWSKDDGTRFSTADDLDKLSPGFYKLIVTDANGSLDSVFTDITEPDLLTALATGTNNICFGASAGTATVATAGGTTPNTYLWSNGETTEDITNLAAVNYSVIVIDGNGCSAIANYEVTQPTLLTAVATGTSTSCANSATVNAAGGTGAYSYLWSNAAITKTISNISAGTYSVTVTDANGCTAIASVTVTANEAFNPSASATNVSCFGGTNGSIAVTNANATAPFSFSIDGVNFQAGTLPYVFSKLSAGTYTIAVRDANGCTGFVTKTVSQPAALTVVLINVQSTCAGAATGAITVTVSGGSGALSYAWTGTAFSSTQKDVSTLAAGNYTLTVTDNNGCTANLVVAVPSFNAIIYNAVVSNISCKGQANGAINLTVSGGTGTGFNYNWNNGATTEDISNLLAGNYSVNITDRGSGCVANQSYTVTQPASNIALAAAKTNATGCGGSLGTITATGSGGTIPYQYKLDNGLYQSSGLFVGLYAGNFTVWIKDASGCSISKLVAITDNGTDQYESNNSKSQAKAIAVGANIFARIALSTDAADWFKFTTPAGTASYTMSMAHPTVNYNFNLYAAANNSPALVPGSSGIGSKTYILAGNSTYYISVTGGLSFTCYQLSVTTPLSVKASPAIAVARTVSDEPTSDNLKAIVFPNPHQGNFSLHITSPEDGKASIELFTASGQKITTKNVLLKKGTNNLVPFTGMRAGIILYRLQAGKYITNGKIIGIE